jgi:hypothetical protein
VLLYHAVFPFTCISFLLCPENTFQQARGCHLFGSSLCEFIFIPVTLIIFSYSASTLAIEGHVRTGYTPVLTVTSDQDSKMFAAANFLSYQCGLRSVWFPDINHQESNVEKSVLIASGLGQVNEKVMFLSRLPYGPQRDAGHWFGQMRLAFEASVLRVFIVSDLFWA